MDRALMEGHQLSLDEYKKCVNACVKVAIFDRLKEQLPDEEGTDDEIDHGSGFIIDDKRVITCKHVVQDALDDETKEIRISNAVIRKLLCRVVAYDPRNDLALLCCEDLDLRQNGICPLQLSGEALWPSISISTLGYPTTHAGETALYVRGCVSGSIERYGREPFIVLDCDVIHGNSGGPVICRIENELKVVAVLVQRHKKDILTLEEWDFIEQMRLSSQLNFTGSDNHVIFLEKLIFKLLAAFETHCQFNLCNAVPGHLVISFIGENELPNMIQLRVSDPFHVSEL